MQPKPPISFAQVILDALPARIAVLDAGGLILAVNQAWERFSRDSGGNLPAHRVTVGANYIEVCRHAARAEGDPDPMAAVAMDGIQRVLDGRQAQFAIEYPCAGPEAPDRWFLLQVTPCPAAALGDGAGAGAVVAHIDITTQKRAQAAERHAAEESLRSSRAKDLFLSTLSHELRTPLAGVLLWVQLLRRGALTGNEAASALAKIEELARAQQRLLEDVLDVSRIMAGHLHIEHEPVNLAEPIAAALSAAEPAALGKQVALRVDSGPLAAGVTVLGDVGRLQQVFGNLLSNAVKFTPTGGQIELLVRLGDARVWVEVKDTGEGIDAAILPHVFDMFRRADGSIARRHEGLGLGLWIVRYLVERHGGAVTAESPGLGQGATFRVELPVAFDPPHATHATSPLAPRGGDDR